jgi:hypothetical protein
MARGMPRPGQGSRATMNNEVRQETEPVVNGNGPAEAYRHHAKKRHKREPADAYRS